MMLKVVKVDQGSASHDDEDDYDYGDDTSAAVDKKRKNPGTFH